MNRRRPTQEQLLLQLLQERAGGWVPVYELAGIALQYSARIHALRQAGHRIENKTEHRDGRIFSRFRLVQPKGQQTLFPETQHPQEAIEAR